MRINKGQNKYIYIAIVSAMWLDYKPTRYEGKGFLRNLNIRIHRDITGKMWFGVGVFF
jgi:hypothetical protein